VSDNSTTAIIKSFLVRAAKIVLAGENLMKLIAELKTFLVIYDFPAINENLKKRSNALEEEVSNIIYLFGVI